MNKKDLIHSIFAGLLILSIGLTSGYSIGYFQTKKLTFSSIQEIKDINPNIATIKFMETKAGVMYGRVDGENARIAYSPEHIFDLNPGESFEIPIYSASLGAFYTNQNIPPETEYIASSQGKYYYHILNPKAFKITPKNRIYFKKEEEAIKMGYSSKE